VAAVYVAVVGAGNADTRELDVAETIGRRLAEREAIVVTGGLGGVMEAASKGARAAGGTTVGILPGSDRTAANAWVLIAIPTGLGEARNALVVRAADALIAIGGEYGTLSEIALGLKTGKPVIGVGSWAIEGVRTATDAGAAVELALAQTGRGSPIQ
jgi:uncharacterized protein (TIGR00725 family)